MAAWASASLLISTKPNPLLRPVARSWITCATLDGSEFGEQLLQVGIAELKSQVPHIQLLAHHNAPRRNWRPVAFFPGHVENRPRRAALPVGRRERQAKTESSRIDVAGSSISNNLQYSHEPLSRDSPLWKERLKASGQTGASRCAVGRRHIPRRIHPGASSLPCAPGECPRG